MFESRLTCYLHHLYFFSFDGQSQYPSAHDVICGAELTITACTSVATLKKNEEDFQERTCRLHNDVHSLIEGKICIYDGLSEKTLTDSPAQTMQGFSFGFSDFKVAANQFP